MAGPAYDTLGLVDRAGADLVGAVRRERWCGFDLLSYPNRPPTVLDVLDRAVHLWPDRPVMTDASTGETLTTDALARRVEAAAAALGVAPGDRVAVAAGNGTDLAVALFACARVQAVMVGLNVRLADEQWAYQLSHSGSVALLAAAGLIERAAAAAAAAGLPSDAVRPIEEVTAGSIPWGFDPARDRPDEATTFQVVYTSGTTGRPKASQVVHRASVHSGLSYLGVLQPTGDDVHAVVFPLSYISALHAHVLPSLATGGRLVMIPEPDPLEIAAAVWAEGVTMLYVVPALWGRLLRTEGFDDSGVGQLRLGASGGAPMPGSTRDRMRTRLPGMRHLEIYGLSETHSPATMCTDDELVARPGSVGRPLPCMEAVLVDEAGDAVEAGGPGELWLRGSLVTTGYQDDPAATAAAMRDGWFVTGDIARIDGEGYVWILDRTKDMINRGGHKVFSAEIERVLGEHPMVEEAAVVGVPDRTGGEAIAAFVVRRDDALGEFDVRAVVAERYADYAAPRWVRFVATLPRTTNGKVAKDELRAELRAELTAPPPPLPPA